METTSIINLMPSTKDELESFVSRTVQSVDSGETNPLQLKAQLKFIEAAIKKIDEQTKDAQLKELDKYPKGPVEMYGFKIEPMEAGTYYDYRSTGDPEWIELDKINVQSELLIVKRQKFLKLLTKQITVVDEETGEVVTINPPIKKSTSSLKFTMK